MLRRLGGLELVGPRLDVWRAPTDNDEGYHGSGSSAVWRAHGLDRMQPPDALGAGRRRRARRADARARRPRPTRRCSRPTRGPRSTDGLALALEVVPDREWDFPLPRLGVRFAVPAALDRVEWFGRGPGEAYPDSRLAARVGRFALRSPSCRRRT